MLRKALLAILAALVVLVGVVSLPGSAGAVTVSRAELKGGQLRLDGANAVPGVFVMVESASSSTTWSRRTSARTTAWWSCPTGRP
jgi:hypothetical protein